MNAKKDGRHRCPGSETTLWRSSGLSPSCLSSHSFQGSTLGPAPTTACCCTVCYCLTSILDPGLRSGDTCPALKGKWEPSSGRVRSDKMKECCLNLRFMPGACPLTCTLVFLGGVQVGLYQNHLYATCLCCINI